MDEDKNIWQLLDVPGWRRVVYFETEPGTWDLAPPGTALKLYRDELGDMWLE